MSINSEFQGLTSRNHITYTRHFLVHILNIIVRFTNREICEIQTSFFLNRDQNLTSFCCMWTQNDIKKWDLGRVQNVTKSSIFCINHNYFAEKGISMCTKERYSACLPVFKRKTFWYLNCDLNITKCACVYEPNNHDPTALTPKFIGVWGYLPVVVVTARIVLVRPISLRPIEWMIQKEWNKNCGFIDFTLMHGGLW